MKLIRPFFLVILISLPAFAAEFDWASDSGAAGGNAARNRDTVTGAAGDSVFHYHYCGCWPAYCEDEHRRVLGGKLELGLGVQVETSPYKKYDADWGVGPVIDYENDYMYIRDFSIGAKLFDLKNSENKSYFTASVFASYEDFEFDPDDTDDARLQFLDYRRSSLYMGVNVTAMTKIGLFEVSASRDVIGHGNGMHGRVAYNVAFNLGNVLIAPRAGVHWADMRYNKYFYGVGRREARRSNLSAYRPNGSISPFVGVAALVPVTNRWEIGVNTEVAFMPKTVKNSPMTGKSATFTIGAMVNYKF